MYSSNNSSSLMAFEENLNSVEICAMMIMPNSSPPNNNNLFENNDTSQNITSFFMENNQNINSDDHGGSSSSSSLSLRAKIMAHPHYHGLLAAYVNCQKIGAPPEVVARLEEAYRVMLGQFGSGCIGEDRSLDQFMEAYCEMLNKYEQELSKPFKEAMMFLSRIETQFKSLTLSSSDEQSGFERKCSSEEEAEIYNAMMDPQAEDKELKGRLLRKYSGYLGNLKQEFMKKKKKGKLPKEARSQLFEWWSRNHKWPYPSESQKMELAESTGLDPKQINNWFINQRKRHWKPSEDMQFVMMDPNSNTHAAAVAAHRYYMDHVLGNPFPMDISPFLL